MTVIVSKPAVNLREELASLRNQGGYSEQQFYFDGLVTNGDYSDGGTGWVAGVAGITYVDGVARYVSVSNSFNNRQSGIITPSKTYLVTYTILNYSVGNIQIKLNGSTSVLGAVRSANGTYTDLLTASSTADGVLCFTTSNSFSGDIDDVSVFEVDANDDVVHRMPKGWVPKDVYEDGLLQREGAAHDYEVVYDGFDYYVKPAVAPSATTQTCVIGVKA